MSATKLPSLAQYSHRRPVLSHCNTGLLSRKGVTQVKPFEYVAAVLLFIMALVVVPWSYSTWMQRTGSGSYGPGIAVTGSPSMSGAQVDKVLCQDQSPDCGTGYTMYSYVAQYGIDLSIAHAVFNRES